MKVLFLGQTGVNLTWGVEKLAHYCRLNEMGLKEDQLESYGDNAISTYFVEKQLSLPSYLDLDSLFTQQQMWNQAFEKTLELISKEKSKHYFLGMNLPHYRKDKFFPVPDTGLIIKFQPDIIITMIDDVHTCYQRIIKRPRTRSNFTLKDILVWRSVSVYIGDILANTLSSVLNKQIKNNVVAVKHPPSMFQKLIFHPEVLRSYCSFSISGIRNDNGKKQAINKFRQEMHDRFCIFDPLTIDDRMIQNKLEQVKSAGAINPNDVLTIKKDERWDLGDDFSLMADVISEEAQDSVFPIDIKISEIQEVAEKKTTPQGEDPSVIDNHIRERDFRLIDQSDTMVTFRPNISGTITGGVTAEANYASQINPKTWYYFWPKDDGDIESGPFKPFAGIGIPYSDQDDLMKFLVDNTKSLKKD